MSTVPPAHRTLRLLAATRLVRATVCQLCAALVLAEGAAQHDRAHEAALRANTAPAAADPPPDTNATNRTNVLNALPARTTLDDVLPYGVPTIRVADITPSWRLAIDDDTIEVADRLTPAEARAALAEAFAVLMADDHAPARTEAEQARNRVVEAPRH